MKLGKRKGKKVNDVFHDLKWNELWDDVGNNVTSRLFDTIDKELWDKNDNESELTFFSLFPEFDVTELAKFLDENRE